MEIFLLIRPNIANFIILTNLLLYLFYWGKKNKTIKNNFTNVVLGVYGHVIFGLITEITVNYSNVPKFLNNICHFFYLTFAVLFCAEFYRYMMILVLPQNKVRRHTIKAHLLLAIGVVSLLVFKLRYVQGKYTNYVMGTGIYICYIVAAILFISGIIIFIRYRERVEFKVYGQLIPISILTMIFMVLQMIFQEFLFTETALTIMVFNIFITIENPIRGIQQRAFIDYTTGLFNRNCFEYDMEELKGSELPNEFAIVSCDLNHLKYINDHFGHLQGDKLIVEASNLLSEYIKGTEKVYRIGGDEFMAIYLGEDSYNVESDIAKLRDAIEVAPGINGIPFQMAVGFAKRLEGETIEQVIARSDEQMYIDKEIQKVAYPL